VGAVYGAAVFASLLQWVFTEQEKQKGRGIVRRGLAFLFKGEAKA
jgi:hypothetical protein